MGFTDQYRTIADLPETIPVFPLAGAILLPRGQLPLNIFEPRYLKPPLRAIGCAGRITSYAETGDGRIVITLTGISRFHLQAELTAMTPYRQFKVDWEAFADDLIEGHGQDAVSRERLLEILKEYLDTHGLQADWRAIRASSNEALVNSLCTISPYGPREKQALLEAKTLEDRNQMLIALTEQALHELAPGDVTVQ